VLPLFVAVSWLLREDARARSSRVFLTIPLIALWGNLHGSAVLAVGLVFLHVAESVWPRRTAIGRNLCLGALAPAALFATPYAAHVAGYYRTILLNGDFARYVPDWMPTSLSAGTVAFYILAALVVIGLARAPDSLTRFERWSLVALLVLAVEANRGVTWFALFALVTAPASWGTVRLPSWRMPAAARTALVAASVLAVTVALGVAASRPRSWFTADYPRTAARAANVAAGPAGRVFANGAYADWLLVVEPTLRGRVAYDARFEVLPHGRLAQAAAVSIGRWDAPRILQPYDVVVLRPGESELRATLTRSGSWRRVAADRKVVVLERTGGRST
jgi:hypothetical protein